jgi:hypothetical protein
MAGRIAQHYGVGLEHAGDVGGEDFVTAGFQIKWDGSAGDGEVLIVDGERSRSGGGLLSEGRRESQEGREWSQEKIAVHACMILSSKCNMEA